MTFGDNLHKNTLWNVSWSSTQHVKMISDYATLKTGEMMLKIMFINWNSIPQYYCFYCILSTKSNLCEHKRLLSKPPINLTDLLNSNVPYNVCIYHCFPLSKHICDLFYGSWPTSWEVLILNINTLLRLWLRLDLMWRGKWLCLCSLEMEFFCQGFWKQNTTSGSQ